MASSYIIVTDMEVKIRIYRLRKGNDTNKDRPAGPVDILGSLGPATFVSSNRTSV